MLCVQIISAVFIKRGAYKMIRALTKATQTMTSEDKFLEADTKVKGCMCQRHGIIKDHTKPMQPTRKVISYKILRKY